MGASTACVGLIGHLLLFSPMNRKQGDRSSRRRPSAPSR
ncbi:hypothetical protein [Pseudonocardia dioxanivorans]